MISERYWSRYYNFINSIMAKKQLISARLDPQTLAKIEAFTNKHYYWKRNSVISNVLDAVFDCFSDGDIYDLVRYSRHHDRNASGSFSLNESTN